MKIIKVTFSFVIFQVVDAIISNTFADNCGSLSDCWNTLTAAATTAVAVAVAAVLAFGLNLKEKTGNVGNRLVDKIEDLNKWYENFVKETVNKYLPKGQELTNQEGRFIAENPILAAKIFENSNFAKERTKANFPGLENFHNNEADAFRHFVWSAMNARDIGIEDARKYSIAHEMFKENFEETLLEFKMDTWNNAKGLEFGSSQKGLTNDEIEKQAREMIRDRKLFWFE